MLKQVDMHHVIQTDIIDLTANPRLYEALESAVRDMADAQGLTDEWYLEEFISSLDIRVEAHYIRD